MAARRKSELRARAAVVPFPERSARGAALVRLIPSGRSLLVALALVAVAGSLYAGARSTGAFAVRHLDVRGAPPPVAHAARAALAPVLGESLVTLDGGEVVRRLEAVPEIAAASYDRAFPSTLVLTIVPEQPAAVLRRGSEAWLVSVRGRLLRRLPRAGRAELPRIWVKKDVRVARGALLGDEVAARAVAAVAPLALDPFPVRIRAVRPGEGTLTFELASGLELQLGDARDLRLKLAVARRIVPSLARPAEGGPAYLNLSVADRPVAGTTLDSEVELES